MLNLIEREIKALDDLVLSIKGPLRDRRQLRDTISDTVKEPSEREEKKSDMEINEKTELSSSDEPMWFLCCARPFSWGAFLVRRLFSGYTGWKLGKSSTPSPRKDVTSPLPPLIRMASKRRVVTSLTRLLNTKSDVVSQIRKRLAGNGLMGPDVHFPEHDLAEEVVVYLGDIQGSSNHILPGFVVPCLPRIMFRSYFEFAAISGTL